MLFFSPSIKEYFVEKYNYYDVGDTKKEILLAINNSIVNLLN